MIVRITSQKLCIRAFRFMEHPFASTVTFLSMIILTLVAASCLTGCETLKQNPIEAKIVIQYAVAKFIENSNPSERAARIDRIQSIASDVKSSASNQATTLDALSIFAKSKVQQLNLSPADKTLAYSLVDLIAAELTKKISSANLKADDVVLIASVMDWIIEAAQLAKG